MKHFTLLILALSFLAPAFGQIVTKDQVETKAERKASQRVDRRIDQSMDRGLDAIENAVFNRGKKRIKDKGNEKIEEELNESVSSSSDGTGDNPYPGMFGGSANVKEQYSFTAQTDIKTIMTDKKGKKEEVMKYRMYFSGTDPWFGMEMLEMTQKGVESMFMIFDLENNQLVSLTESNGQKMGFAMSFDPSAYNEIDEADATGTDSDVSFRKTGRTKTIQGYTCDEYVTESEDGSGSMWVTKEESLQIGFAMAAMGSMAGKEKNNQNLPKDYPKGALLEMDYLQKDGSKMFWTTEDIKLNIRHTISTSGYQIMGMPGGK